MLDVPGLGQSDHCIAGQAGVICYTGSTHHPGDRVSCSKLAMLCIVLHVHFNLFHRVATKNR